MESSLLFVSDIEWDTDHESAEDYGLPSSVVLRGIPREEIADTLSNDHGFCVKSYSLE